VGIIIGSKGCSADEAFELLTRQSQHENRKLRDVAIDLVTSKLRSGRSTSQSARGAGAFSEMETRSAIEVGQRWQTVGAHDEWFCDSPHTEHASRVVATAMIVAGILGNVNRPTCARVGQGLPRLPWQHRRQRGRYCARGRHLDRRRRRRRCSWA
jgi:hypothetical protein